MPRRLSTSVFATALLAVVAALALYARPVVAAPAGSYVGTSLDLQVATDGKSLSLGYTIASPRAGCASKVEAFGIPLLPDLTGFRMDKNPSVGVLAGRPTPNEPVTVAGYWDGFTQFAAAGVITTDPTPGTDCAPVRRAWRAAADGAPVLGANIFANATGPATVAGQNAPSGTVTISTNAKGDALESFAVTYQQGACKYERKTTSADYGIGATNPLLLDNGPSFFGLVAFGMISGAMTPGGARGGVIIDGTGDCPTVALTYVVTSGGTAVPTTTPTATATATPVPTATATPVATATPTATATATPAPTAVKAQFLGTPVFGSAGQALAVFSGGTVADLEAAAKTAGATGIWAQDSSGSFKLLVIGGPGFINDAFRSAFPTGFAAAAPLTLTR